ncbi:MAG: bifunctional (p)ppGpp synthetase/guanosine-3',5'-bis(diphosphate) 3'-pyrophosphohydrolase [Acidobacteriota bacterium]|nr:bifunctional (p)ppGpp synthetase/guanosine-3',5'-bis(diphosphate) 3'-pyrophosphohydrolase [Acidobacteriota bacterium]MDW3228396.1 bifunctional (p)ppGpp synthetase/guanosine-3',5'-bis(diphosphate) 3'-pyrophosphohydrolase [Acidobacteriota bacterium]
MIRFNDIAEKIQGRYSEKDIRLLQKAYIFAARAHRGQIRRSGEPYLSHPLEVTNILAEMNLDLTTLIAGLLHDVLEDTEVTAAEIKENFGKEVASLVEGVTKITRLEDSPADQTRAETIRKIILAMTDDLRVIFIKLADRWHNLKTLHYLSEDKQTRIARETLEIYAPIANRLGMGRIRAELEDLSFRYVDPDEYFRMVALVEPELKKGEKELKKLKKIMEQLLKENGLQAEIQFRIKRLYSIYSKMQKKGVDFDQVYDFLALRIITDSIKNCYAILGIIHQRWPHLPQRFRDFIAMPKPTLYQSLHTTIITENKQTFEIQIRTHEMHELAENGIAAHWKYKEGAPTGLTSADQRLQWLREIAALFSEQKNPKEFLKNLKINLIPEEIYAFTPKGKVIGLPPGATALDFAFKIHTEIGLHAKEARINGELMPLKTPLKTGDIVNILTSPDRSPNRSWLHWVATASARQNIKKYLNLKTRKKAIELGQRLWEKETRKFRLPSELRPESVLIGNINKEFKLHLHNLEDLYLLAGLGKVVVNRRFLERLAGELSETKPHRGLLKKMVDRLSGQPLSQGIVITNLEERMITLAGCCSPIKGEPVVGYLTSGKGLTIHAQRCYLVQKEILDTQRLVEVSWDPALKETFKAKLVIYSKDSPGVLASVATAVAELNGNISRAEVSTSSDQKANISLEISIGDLDHLKKIIERISRLPEVNSVVRY